MNAQKVYQHSPWWAQNGLLNLHALQIHRHRYGQRLETELERLLESQYWPLPKLRQQQLERLRSVLAHAHEHSAYYRRALADAGYARGTISSLDDVARLPVLTREIIRSEPSLLTQPRPGRDWLHGHTSGTTGSPLSLWYDRATCIMNNAVDYRQKRWGGMRRGDWIGNFLGRVVVTPRQRSPFWRVNLVHRQVWFSSFHLDDDNLAAYVAEIRRRGLRFIEGYPSTLFILARFLESRNDVLPLQAVFASSETLHDIQRATIERAFQCEIYDFYGHAERAIFATECELHAGKHIAEEYGLVEVVDAENRPLPPGEFGYLVGTSLHNTAMPMIRYRTGDISAIREQPCACGRTLRLIENISTKAEDIIVTPEGRLISPSVMTHPFKPYPQILKSQIVQDAIDHLTVRVVPSEELAAEHQAELVAAMQLRVGPRMKIELLLVDDIPREPSGKFRWVISKVNHAYRFSWDGQDSERR